MTLERRLMELPSMPTTLMCSITPPKMYITLCTELEPNRYSGMQAKAVHVMEMARMRRSLILEDSSPTK